MDNLAPYLLKCLLRGLPETVYFKDRDSRFILVSEFMAFLHGFKSAEEMIGKSDTDLFSPEHAKLARQEELEILETGVPRMGQLQKLSWADGHESWALSSKMPLRGPNDAIIGTFAVTRDITRTRKIEEALQSARVKLVEASRAVGEAEVTNGVLHNVSNAITAVSCSSEVVIEGLREMNTCGLVTLCDTLPGVEDLKLLAHQLDDEKASLVSIGATLQSSIDHASKVIKLQQSDAMTAGAIERLSAAELVEGALRITENELKRHKVKVVHDYHVVEKVLGNKHRALQVLINLIQNAIQSVSRAANFEKRITISIESHDRDRVTISVTDNGVGIPRENLGRIFCHGFTTREDGHGFGLSSSVLAAQGMGALLSAYSEGPGQGATFVFVMLSSKSDVPTYERELAGQY